jgi:hypothetical protein
MMKIARDATPSMVITKVNKELDHMNVRFVLTASGRAGDHYEIEAIERIIRLDMDDERERFVLEDMASGTRLTVANSADGVEQAATFIFERPCYDVDEDGAAYGEEVFEDFVENLIESLGKRINPFALDNTACRRVYEVMERRDGLPASTLGPIVRRQCERLVARGVLRLHAGRFHTVTQFRDNPSVRFFQPAGHDHGVGGAPGPVSARGNSRTSASG